MFDPYADQSEEKQVANHLLTVPPDYPALPVPVPPMLEEAIGYDSRLLNREADFVSFYWGDGNEAYWYDGAAFSCVSNRQAYLLFIKHPKVKPYLADPKATAKGRQYLLNHGLSPKKAAIFTVSYNLGSAEIPNEYRLVLDRRHRKLFVVLERDAVSLLERQWTPDGELPQPPTEQEIEQAGEQFIDLMKQLDDSNSELYQKLDHNITVNKMIAAAEAERLLYNELKTWLENA